VTLDIRPFVSLRLTLLHTSEIKGAFDTQALNVFQIVWRQIGQVIGAKYFPPLQGATHVTHIATQVPEVRGAS
jgi:hypothetical protein